MLSLAAAGRFDQRILWARVRGEVAELHRLATLVRLAARHVGLSVEERPYQPHVTLAVARGDVDLKPAVAERARLESSPWTIGEFRLMRSRNNVDPNGCAPRYETLATWPILPLAPDGSWSR
jgi:2'-5' RNA ligase